MQKSSLNNVYPKQNPRCVYRVIEDMCLIVDVDRLLYHTLNEVGSIIWGFCDGKHSIGEIISHIQNNFSLEEKKEVIGKDCIRFINNLQKKNILSL